jgi:protein-S-isoprenylcysteine O-methyltransferase Ste14
MNVLEYINQIVKANPTGWFFIIVNGVIMVCVFVLFSSIIIDFALFHHKGKVIRKKSSFIETGTMFVFFCIYCIILKSNIGHFSFRSILIIYIVMSIGLLFIVAGTIINITGRFILKDNWANQVTIYEAHTLVNKGVYSSIRHPLYASIIWMLTGGAMVYFNYLALIAVLIIFTPMMVYRALQEETLLSKNLPGYIEYRAKTGMFFPKI